MKQTLCSATAAVIKHSGVESEEASVQRMAYQTAEKGHKCKGVLLCMKAQEGVFNADFF